MRVSTPGSSDSAVLTTVSNTSANQLNNHLTGMGSVTNYTGKNGVPQQGRTMSPATPQLSNEWPNSTDGFNNNLGIQQGNVSLNSVGNSRVVYAKPSVTTTMASVNATKQLTTLTTVNKIPHPTNSNLPPVAKPQVQITSTQLMRGLQPGAVQLPGMVLARNQNGQLVLVNSNSLASSSSSTPTVLVTQAATSGAVATLKTSTAVGAAITQPLMVPQTTMTVPSGQIVARTVVPVTNAITVKTVPAKQAVIAVNKFPSTSQETTRVQTPQSISLSQEDAVNVTKCRNFLTTLIKLASAGTQTAETVSNVKKLVQNLIDDKIEPEHFTQRLQIELNSAPQPYLVPFLKRSLPLLRLTMMQQSGGAGQVPPSIAVAAMRASSASSPSPTSVTANSTKTVMLTKRPPVRAKNTVPEIRLPRVSTSSSIQFQRLAASANNINVCRSSSVAMPPPAALTSSPRHLSQKWASPGGGAGSGGGSFKDDDDINDVASMAGVNLSEESDRILATNSDLVGSQVRSCKDSTIVNTTALTRKLAEIVSKRLHVQQLHPDVINFTAHAVETRVKDLIEKVSLVAFHRIANYKDNEHYEASQDVKSQLKFLFDLDILEKKRHAQSEREVLMRAMKSRSKNEDPEQLRLKQKAKEMQQMEMEILQIRNADETARNAIGPRKKKIKLEPSVSRRPTDSKDFSSSPFRSTPSRARVKRVNVKDLMFVLEQEKDTNKSKILYRSYLK